MAAEDTQKPPNPQPQGVSAIKILILVWSGALLVGSAAVFLHSKLMPPRRVEMLAPATAHSRLTPPELLPVIQSFLEAHRDLGYPIEAETLSNWALGNRQRVTLEISGTRRNLLFYIKDQQVVTVYEDGTQGRKKVWGDSATNPENSMKRQ